MHSISAFPRALHGGGPVLPRVVLGASAGLLALAIAGPVQAAPPVRAQVHDGVLRVTGTPFSDAIRLSLAVGDPSTVDESPTARLSRMASEKGVPVTRRTPSWTWARTGGAA